MARFSSFLGRQVEVQYRASDTLLPASGIFVADSGRSIFLEQSFEQRGQHRHFRWEIPYQHLVRIGLAILEEDAPLSQSAPAQNLRVDGQSAQEAHSFPSAPKPILAEAPGNNRPSQPPSKEKLASREKATSKETLASGAAAGIGLVSAVLPMSNRSKPA
jgi:hypothetical protein